MADKSIRYAPEFRRQMVELVRSGRTAASLHNGMVLIFLTPWLGGMMQPEVFYGKADLQSGVQA